MPRATVLYEQWITNDRRVHALLAETRQFAAKAQATSRTGVLAAEVLLGVGDGLQGDFRLRVAGEVELTDPRHPLVGRRVPAVAVIRRTVTCGPW